MAYWVLNRIAYKREHHYRAYQIGTDHNLFFDGMGSQALELGLPPATGPALHQ